MKILFSSVLFILSSCIVIAAENPVVSQKIEGDYFEVSSNIRAAIVGKGINVAHILPASNMLHRTGSAYGYSSDIYANAQIFEFCSAKISQKLSRLDPENIVLCPFTISVFTLVKEPGFVYLSYRIPVGKTGSEAVTKEIVELIEGIIDDAKW